MKKPTTIQSLIIVVAILILFFVLKDYSPSFKKKVDLAQKRAHYEKTSHNSEYEGLVTHIFSFKGSAYILLSDSSKYWIPHSRNYNYNSSWLNEFIKPKDFISKNPFSDTLWINRNQQRFYFIIGKDVK